MIVAIAATRTASAAIAHTNPMVVTRKTAKASFFENEIGSRPVTAITVAATLT